MMKPQDILILLKVLLWERRAWTQLELARALSMSASEVNQGLKRLEAGMLYDPVEKSVLRYNFLDFLLVAAKHVFPAELGPLKRGIPTSHAGPILSKELVFNTEDVYVWPHPKGESRGQSLKPIYRSAPEAARNDAELYELLTLVDALRVGRARESNLAKQYLRKRFLGNEAISA